MIYVLGIFYLPFVIFPALMVWWIYSFILAPAPKKIVFGVLLIISATLWFQSAGHEIFNEWMDRAKRNNAQKINIETHDHKAPKILVYCLDGTYKDKQYPKQITLNKNGFVSNNIYIPGSIYIQQFQHKSKEGVVTRYSLKARSNDCVIARADNLGYDIYNKLSDRLGFLSLDPEKIQKYYESGEHLEDIVKSLTKYE